MTAMRVAFLWLAPLLAACVAQVPQEAAHSFAWFPRGLCPQGVRVEAVGFALERVRVGVEPVAVEGNGFLLPLQTYPVSAEEALATPPWRWEGAARAFVPAGSGRYRFLCLPYGLPPLEGPTLYWGGGDQLAVVVQEDPGSPSGLRVSFRKW